MGKIFCIGFHKTGTSTLDQALKALDYKVCGPRIDLANSLFKNDLSPLWKITETYDAFQDNPWALLYKELDAKYPGSKFILTLRDDKKWLKSIVNYFGKTSTDMRKYIYGVGYPVGNEAIYLARYQQHNNQVRQYFKDRPGDLIELSWEKGDGWGELCGFLDKPVPSIPFPHANKGSDAGQKRKSIGSRFKKKFKRLIKRFKK